MAKHTTLASLFSDIAAAIRAKTGKTDKLVADDFPTAIAGITTGVNTSDATVTAADVASGVIAYGKGGKVTGTVTTVKSGSTRGYTADTIESSTVASSYVFGSKTLPAAVLLRSGAIVQIRQRCSSFGDATAADVRSGKTFTSAAGFKVTGTYGDMDDTIQHDWGEAAIVNSTQLRITITRSTKPLVLAWKIETATGSTGDDGTVLGGMAMRTAGSSETQRYSAILKSADASSSTGYVMTTRTFSNGVTVYASGSAANTWNITLYAGNTLSSDLSYVVDILTGSA